MLVYSGLRGGAPPPAGAGLSDLEWVVNPDVFDLTYGNIPAQPHGSSRVWAFNSFAQLRARGGVSSESVAQRIGYHMPPLAGFAAEFRSGLWAAAADRESVATVPGASSAAAEVFVGPADAAARGPRV